MNLPDVNFSLSGKLALVTGGSRGIGRAIALGLAQFGADVVVASRKLSDLQSVADDIKKLGRKSLAIAAHIGRVEEITSLVNVVNEQFGRIDILVNNAGTNPTMDAAIDLEERAWDVIMNVNLKGLFFLSQQVAKIMIKQGSGTIINISSKSAVKPGLLPVYTISKGGVNIATRVLAREWTRFNIRVNDVAPGLTKARFSEALYSDPDILKKLLSIIPMNRIGKPEEIVGAVIYLASDASSFVTGQIIGVDGGETI